MPKPSKVTTTSSTCFFLLSHAIACHFAHLFVFFNCPALQSATKPVTLTLKSKNLLEAKIEENELSRPPNKPIATERPSASEFEVKLRNTKKEDMFVIKSGSDFIVRSVRKGSLPDRKGIHPMDEIVGIDGM